MILHIIYQNETRTNSKAFLQHEATIFLLQLHHFTWLCCWAVGGIEVPFCLTAHNDSLQKKIQGPIQNIQGPLRNGKCPPKFGVKAFNMPNSWVGSSSNSQNSASSILCASFALVLRRPKSRLVNSKIGIYSRILPGMQTSGWM